jgi:hypothetical protein
MFEEPLASQEPPSWGRAYHYPVLIDDIEVPLCLHANAMVMLDYDPRELWRALASSPAGHLDVVRTATADRPVNCVDCQAWMHA